MLTVSEEVARCLPPFIVLCLRHVVADEMELDEAAETVAHAFSGRLAARRQPDDALADHFAATVDTLSGLVASMARAAPSERLRNLIETTSEARVSGLLEQVALKMMAAKPPEPR